MIEDAYISFFDVLGFTSSFLSGRLSKRYDSLIEMTNTIHDPDVTIFLMSDSILSVLKQQGYPSAFVDTLLDFDKKRQTSLYKEVNNLSRLGASKEE